MLQLHVQTSTRKFSTLQGPAQLCDASAHSQRPHVLQERLAHGARRRFAALQRQRGHSLQRLHRRFGIRLQDPPY